MALGPQADRIGISDRAEQAADTIRSRSPEAVETGTVRHELEETMELLERLDAIVSQVQAGLAPVLGPDRAGATLVGRIDDDARATVSDMRRMVIDVNATIRRLSDRLVEMGDRIEI